MFYNDSKVCPFEWRDVSNSTSCLKTKIYNKMRVTINRFLLSLPRTCYTLIYGIYGIETVYYV